MATFERGHLPRSRRAAFARGARASGIGAPLLALLLAVGVIATAVAIVSHGDYVAVPESRLLRLGGDDATHIAYQVSAIRQRQSDAVPVYVLGGSAMREATISDGSIGRALTSRSGYATEAFTLAGNEQTFAHDRAIIENLPTAGRRGGIVVIGVGFERFMRSSLLEPGSAAIEGLLIRGGASGSVDEPDAGGLDDSLALARDLSRYASTYAREHAGELLSFDLPSTPFVAHRYTPGDAWSATKKRRALAGWYETAGTPGGAFDRVFPSSADDLRRTVAAARERGFAVVLAEQPYDLQVADGKLDRLRARTRALCIALAAENDGVYLDFLAASGLDSDDYHDVSHLLPSGRPKYELRLVAGLAPVVALVGAPAPRRHASLPVAALQGGSVSPTGSSGLK
jgi:hypothetical protein